jgi:DNA-binding transcriptional LysR family regulator
VPNKLKLRQLEGFVHAADLGSFAMAASRMAMTPPAFTQLIRELETNLGVALFDRTTRRVDLTAAGRQLLSSVRRPLQDLDHIEADMRALAGGQRGRVAFSVLHSLAFGIGTRTLSALAQTHPSITVQMIEDENDVLVERVLSREVDFGLGMHTEATEQLSFEALFDDDLVAVFPAGHRLARRREVTWAQLVLCPLILLRPKSSVRRLADAAIVVTATPREPVREVVSMVTAVNMVAAGLGVTVLPELSLPALKMKGLQSRPIVEPRSRRHIGIIRQADRPALPAENIVIQRLRAEVLKSGTC